MDGENSAETEKAKQYRLLQNTIEVDHNGETYVFGIPSFRDEMALGMREREIRRSINPADPSPQGLDLDTYNMIQTAALFELMLKQGPKWCFSQDGSGAPVIDHQKWPAEKSEEAPAVWIKFLAAVGDFRSGRAANGQRAGGKAVESKPNPG
jgi:hypothetical protein